MQIFRSFEEIVPLTKPIALTMGMFDGVHIGHQHLLAELKKHGTAVVLTFSNHPSEILPHRTPVKLLCSLEERLYKLSQLGVAATIVLPFTLELSQLSYDTFLHAIHNRLPFSTLILGEGEAFGHNREGTPEHVLPLGTILGFQALYLKKLELDGNLVSSKRIRQLLEQGKQKEAMYLLEVSALWK